MTRKSKTQTKIERDLIYHFSCSNWHILCHFLCLCRCKSFFRL